MAAPLVVSAWQARVLREVVGSDLPELLVAEQPPARWPLSEPWPPKAAMRAAPCWRCITRRPPGRDVASRYFAEPPLGPVVTR